MSKSLKKLIDINKLREFKNKLVGTDSAYVQTAAVDQTVAGTKTFSKPIVGSVTGSSGSCTGNAATATTATTAKSCTGNAASANIATKATQDAAGNTITTTYATKAENNTKANNSEVVHKSGNETIAGTKTFSNGVLLTNVNALMAQNGEYTLVLRNDGSNTHILMSDKGGVPGTWSAARPLVINNSTGVCSINGNAATATKLAAKRTIALSGAATGTATGFDGSGNITIPVTSLDASKLTGTASVSTTGNAASANIATKATQDSDGNKITTTYSKNGHTHDDRYYTEAEVNNLLAGKANTSDVLKSWPAGVIIPFAGTSVPTGYLLCNGAAVSRTNYANLFAAIGTLYGAGNGSTTFNLPDARDRVLQGASGGHSAGSYISAGIPNITGYAQSTQVGIFHGIHGGALYTENPYQYHAAGLSGSDGNLVIRINASRSSSYYGASSTVQPPAIATNFIIKY